MHAQGFLDIVPPNANNQFRNSVHKCILKRSRVAVGKRFLWIWLARNFLCHHHTAWLVYHKAKTSPRISWSQFAVQQSDNRYPIYCSNTLYTSHILSLETCPLTLLADAFSHKKTFCLKIVSRYKQTKMKVYKNKKRLAGYVICKRNKH